MVGFRTIFGTVERDSMRVARECKRQKDSRFVPWDSKQIAHEVRGTQAT